MSMMPIEDFKDILWERYNDAVKRGSISRARTYMEIINLVTDTIEVKGTVYKQAQLL